jgi:hypothetical protein
MNVSQDHVFETALSLPQSERADLAHRLLKSVEPSAEKFNLAEVIDVVRKVTQDIFPGKCEFTHEFDPEFPGDRYVVVNVEAKGEPKELVHHSENWHKQIEAVVPNSFGNLRLLIVPR